MFTLIWTKQFTKTAKKFITKYPELKKKFAQLLRDLEQDPLQPHLRLHPLTSKLHTLHAVSLTYSYRITLTLTISADEIRLLDIGSHDEVYE
ncbi:MAG: type II toxin-antitoxin system YafQ family toxin [Gammaproteobacteria bacterium]